MLYYLLKSFIEDYSFFNIVIYLSFRSGAALITSLTIVFIFAPKIIDWLRANQKEGQPIREDGPSWHLEMKRGIMPDLYRVSLVIALPSLMHLLYDRRMHYQYWIVMDW